LSCQGFLIDEKCLTYLKNIAKVEQGRHNASAREPVSIDSKTAREGEAFIDQRAETVIDTITTAPDQPVESRDAGSSEVEVPRSVENVLYSCMQHFEVTLRKTFPRPDEVVHV
jgi:hypothetical protein